MNSPNNLVAYNLLCNLVTADSQADFTKVYYEINENKDLFKEVAYILANAFDNGYQLNEDYIKYEGQISERLKLSDYAEHQHDKYFESPRRVSAALDEYINSPEYDAEADRLAHEAAMLECHQEDDRAWF